MHSSAGTLLQRLTNRVRLRHMKVLIALCDLRNMGKVAGLMGTSQPAVSQMIAELESLLETQLFHRHAKGVSPTGAALDLLPIAKRMFAAAEEGVERIATHQQQSQGMVRVASTAAACGALLDPVLPTFARAHPNIKIFPNEVVGQTLDAAFQHDEYDLVCCREKDYIPEGWQFRHVIDDCMVVVCGPQHLLLRKKKPTLEDLKDVTWLQNHVSTVARSHFDKLAADLDWKDVKEVHVLSRIPLIIWSMLRDNAYVTLIPRSVAQPWLSKGLLCELPLDLTLKLPPIGIYWEPLKIGSAAHSLLDALGRQAHARQPKA